MSCLLPLWLRVAAAGGFAFVTACGPKRSLPEPTCTESFPFTTGLGAGGVGGEQLVQGGMSGAAPVGGSTGGSEVAPPNRVSSDACVDNVEIAVHDRVRTILVVTWDQIQAADEVWLEFSYAGQQIMASRPAPGTVGAHRDVVLGVPGETDVTTRIISRQGDTTYETGPHVARTGLVPKGMPRPQILSYDVELASSHRWLFGAVEDSDGGQPGAYYLRTFWLYIIDRQGNIVWYYAEPASNATTSFQRRARDGEYIVLEKRCYGCSGYSESIVKMTLDWQYFEQNPVEDLADCIDVTDDGTVLYDAHNELWELLTDGEKRYLWSCRQHFGGAFNCYSNTVNWDPKSNTVLLSYPYEGVVVQIDRETGELVAEYGNRAEAYEFAPPREVPPEQWRFAFQHFPNLSPDGTLLVSTHMPGCGWSALPAPHRHAFVEFTIDRPEQTLIEKWRYTEGPEWPRAKGMAIRLPGGNTLANYGTGGVIREITPNRYTAWHVKFDVPEGDDFYNKMVGHNELIDDLYALNGGPTVAP